MAINIPIVTEFDAKGLQSAQNAFNNFRTKVAEADGAMGKFKAGAGAALDAVKANAAQFAAAAGAAILGFAVKAIGDFQDLALAADKFANATGLAVEEASALIEVSGDLGIESETVQRAINKMNIAVAKGSDEFKALGVEVARNDQGLIDSNETFIRTVGALGDVGDSAERTRLATAVFGKSWADMSEIIKGGAPALRAAIDSVSDAKIIDPEEVKRAKDLRAAQDALKDAIEDVTLAVGKNLVPAMTNLVNTVTPLLELLGPLTSEIIAGSGATDDFADSLQNNNIQMRLQVGLADKILGFFGLYNDDAEKVYDASELMSKGWAKNYTAAQTMRYAGLRLANAIRELDDDTNGLIDTFDTLLGQFERDEAVEGLTAAFKEYEATVLEALGKGTPEAARAANEAMRGLVREMASVAKQAQLTSEEQVKIVALLEKGQYDLAYAELLKQLAAVPRQIPIQFIGSVSGIPVPSGQTPSETVGVPPTVVDTPYGKFVPLPGGGFGPYKPPTIPSIGAYSAPMNINVNVQGSVVTELDLIESVRKGLVNAQRSGKQLVYSNT
jgi:hypothetical protein